jgi:ATP-dependent Clp protease, protease subunit
MTDENRENVRVLLLDDVESNVANKIIKSIVEINIEDSFLKQEMRDYAPEPIRIIINSYGGSLYDGLGIIGAIESSETPIHTICYGSAMSMSLFILASGDVRKASKYSTMMYHELSGEIRNKMSSAEIEIAEMRRLAEICDNILYKNTKFKKKELNDKKKNGDWFFTAQEALLKGVIDEII